MQNKFVADREAGRIFLISSLEYEIWMVASLSCFKNILLILSLSKHKSKNYLNTCQQVQTDLQTL